MGWMSRLLGGADAGAGGSRARQPEVDEVSLADVRDLPLVAAAITAAPPVWRVEGWAAGDDKPESFSERLETLLDWVWVGTDGGVWQLAVGDELRPLLDLDAAEDDDPVLRTLLADPRVARAWHEDRELYCAEVSAPLGVEDAAALFLRALTRAHEAVASGA